jgi:hypothetical protein
MNSRRWWFTVWPTMRTATYFDFLSVKTGHLWACKLWIKLSNSIRVIFLAKLIKFDCWVSIIYKLSISVIAASLRQYIIPLFWILSCSYIIRSPAVIYKNRFCHICIFRFIVGRDWGAIIFCVIRVYRLIGRNIARISYIYISCWVLCYIWCW